MINILGDPRGGLAVFCQAAGSSPLHQRHHTVKLELAAVINSARGVYIEAGASDAVERKAVSLHGIGITMIVQPGSDEYIAPSLNDDEELIQAGLSSARILLVSNGGSEGHPKLAWQSITARRASLSFPQ
jgi:N-acylglucosamine-6-phosphate 2-epimerase